MPTRIVARTEGINESNLLKIVKEEHCGTIAPEYHVLIAKVGDRQKFQNFLKVHYESLEKIERNNNCNLNKVSFAFVSSTSLILRKVFLSPFLTKLGLELRGIKPLASYGVKTDYSSFRRIKQYNP